MHNIIFGFEFGVGICCSFVVATQFDSFCRDLGSKFWTWKVKHFKDEWTGK